MKATLIRRPNGTFYFLHAGVAIVDPRSSTCGCFRVPDQPKEYGFEGWGTGGGCMSWRLDVLLPDGRPAYMLLTDTDGTSHKAEPGEPYLIGVYTDDDGRAVACWTQAPCCEDRQGDIVLGEDHENRSAPLDTPKATRPPEQWTAFGGCVYSGDVMIATCCDDDRIKGRATREANARLMALSPRLLASLIRLVGEGPDLGEVDFTDEERAALHEARELIAKAKAGGDEQRRPTNTRPPLPPFPASADDMSCEQCLAYLLALKASGWVWHLDDHPAEVFSLEQLPKEQAEALDAFVTCLSIQCHPLVPADEAKRINTGAWSAADLVGFYDSPPLASKPFPDSAAEIAPVLWTADYEANSNPDEEREHGPSRELLRIRFGSYEVGLTNDEAETLHRSHGIVLDSDEFTDLTEFLTVVGVLVDHYDLRHWTRHQPNPTT